MHEDHVNDTDVAQAQEQNTGRSQHAKAKAAKTVDVFDDHLGQQHELLPAILPRAGTKGAGMLFPPIFYAGQASEEDLPENQEIHSLEDE